MKFNKATFSFFEDSEVGRCGASSFDNSCFEFSKIVFDEASRSVLVDISGTCLVCPSVDLNNFDPTPFSTSTITSGLDYDFEDMCRGTVGLDSSSSTKCYINKILTFRIFF